MVAAAYPFAWIAEQAAPEAEVLLYQGAQEPWPPARRSPPPTRTTPRPTSKNADAVRRPESLAGDLEETLGQDCSFDEAIVSHAAYGYLLDPFGKEQHAVTNVGAEGDASGKTN